MTYLLACRLAEYADILELCNTTMPMPDPSAIDFLGTMETIDIPNAEIAYFRFGNSSTGRPAIMLVPGFGSTMAAWPLRFLQALAEDQEVIIFDNRGQGLSKVGF